MVDRLIQINLFITSAENEANFYSIGIFWYTFFILKSEFLQTPIMLKKSGNPQPFVENDN